MINVKYQVYLSTALLYITCAVTLTYSSGKHNAQGRQTRQNSVGLADVTKIHAKIHVI